MHSRPDSIILASEREEQVMGDSKPPSPKRRRIDSQDVADSQNKNWRDVLCGILELGNSATDKELESAVNDFCEGIGDPSSAKAEIEEVEPHYKKLYRIHCSKTVRREYSVTIYEDTPIIKSTDGKDFHLSANMLVTDMDLYIERNRGMSFAVIHEFVCCNENGPNPLGSRDKWGESLLLASEDLYNALLNLNNTPPFAVGQESQHWIFWAFHNLDILRKLPSLYDGIEGKHVSVFSKYFCETKLPDFQSTRKFISNGHFTRQSLGYLFIPGDVVVIRSPIGDAYDICYEQTDWPSYTDRWNLNEKSPGTSPQILNTQITCKFSSWLFDGNFMKVTQERTCQTDISAEGLQIKSLSMIPLSSLPSEIKESLLHRGRMYWKCRKKRYISYGGWDFDRLEHFDNSRFMIDSTLNKALYRQDPKRPKELAAELKDDLGPLVMDQNEPPGDKFLLTAPTFIWGFNMWDKVWRKLAIRNVKDVDWDEKAFENLVIDPDSKDVVQALVTNKIENSISTHLVRGKGSGLILLLHGPPGTGKTMTAESVAEHARKPLYRVTCGDIGTKPEAVEQYLKKVLTLGKVWDCVVLLDEAEVFLQERSLKDIERNALVSVFLRNLEYYEGILILTSNRVGTFDEGFRSRIQLAIHYPKLEQPERRKVWDNFVNRLGSDPIATVDIDIRNLHTNLTELSKFELNGREIRNAINVARPLAKSEGQKVDFESLKKVIKVQQKFYTYMKNMNEGLDDEEVAREEGKR
ncbi:hypothetical protein F5Y03DRAFT_363254 [Xylaria venustula]|nr:hypothetical protein F5Y03DRAFT_363254 [Xylaria venustula]